MNNNIHEEFGKVPFCNHLRNLELDVPVPRKVWNAVFSPVYFRMIEIVKQELHGEDS